MKVTMNLRYPDMYRFNIELAAHPRMWRGHAFDVAALLLVVIAYSYFSRSPETTVEWIFVLIYACVLAVVAKVFASVVIIPALSAIAALNSRALGCHEFELTENGIVERTDKGTLLTHWDHVLSIDELPRYFAIGIEKSTYLVVPRKAFDSPAEANRFFMTCKERWRLSGLPLSAIPIKSRVPGSKID